MYVCCTIRPWLPLVQAELFYEGCSVERKKFRRSQTYSETQFWLHLSIPAKANADDADADADDNAENRQVYMCVRVVVLPHYAFLLCNAVLRSLWLVVDKSLPMYVPIILFTGM